MLLHTDSNANAISELVIYMYNLKFQDEMGGACSTNGGEEECI
jgi:hypothetical protein